MNTALLMPDKKRILYRGVQMIEAWPERIVAAQQIVSYQLEGTDIPRIRYGQEQSDWHPDTVPCHDCGVLAGEFHVPDCDFEECPVCHDQFISCDCNFDEQPDERA